MKMLSILMKNRGSALLLTMLIVTTLVGLILGFSGESDVELNLAAFSRDGLKAHQAAYAGVQMALANLDRDTERTVDSYREDWRYLSSEALSQDSEGSMSFSGRITDESGKFNVNLLLDENGGIDPAKQSRVLRLFKALNLTEAHLAPLLDWLDTDSIERVNGAEHEHYRRLVLPYDCGNGPLATVGQVFLVKGLAEITIPDPGGDQSLLDFLTVSSDGKININTASRQVLQSLSENLDAAMAEGIVEFRNQEDFKAIEDIKNVSGMDDALFNEIKGLITVNSGVFSIRVTGSFHEAVSRITAVARRDENGFKLIYWQVS